MNTSQIKFSSTLPDFFSTVTKRVNEYFKKEEISRFSNLEMVLKTVFMFSLYLVPYAFIVSGLTTDIWLYLFLSALMGFGTAGIGLSIMHDANHGSYSKKKWVNNL